MNKRGNIWFLAGCAVLLAVVVGLVTLLAPPPAADDTDEYPTASASSEVITDDEEDTTPPREFTLTAQQKANITKVLRVYYVTPAQRKETPKSVSSLVSEELAYELEHQWDGLLRNTKATMSNLKFAGAVVIDGEQRVNVTLTVTTTYINASQDVQPWYVSITLQEDGKLTAIEDIPGEGG